MADTLRQKIVDAIDARLKTIKTANGYQTNLGNNVFEWRVTPLNSDTELPGAVYSDTQDTIDLTIGLHLHTLKIVINMAAKGSASPSDMRKLIGDIHKMIGVDVTWGGLAEDTKITSEIILPAHEENKFMGIEITIEVEFTTKPFDPFSQ